MGLFSGKKESKVTEAETQSKTNQQINWEDAAIPVEPLLNRVLILEYEAAERTRSGLILPKGVGANLHEMVIGRILAVGPGKENPQDPAARIPVDAVKRGDVVAFEKYKGLEFVKDKIKYRICWDTELLGKLPMFDQEEQYA